MTLRLKMAVHNIMIILLSLFVVSKAINICPTRTVTLSSGQVTSPKYPRRYPPNTDCRLTIKAPSRTNFTITFSKMDIEGDEDDLSSSCFDWLTIYGVTKKTFCSTKTPASYTSPWKVLVLHMKSDGSVSKTGFDLSFSTVADQNPTPTASVCPTRTITPSNFGYISTTDYPMPYSNNLNCKLTLDVPSNKEFSMTFLNRDIEYSSGCSKDKLAYSDTRSTFSVCGTSSDADQRNFTDGDVSFHLTTDASTTAAGFLISYKLIDKPVSKCSCPSGSSYIKRPITKNNVIKRISDDISLEFKTTSANGLFLFAKGGLRDFILLKLQNGIVIFEIDLGTGNLTVTVPSVSLNDNNWHKVVVSRQRKNVQVTVNDLFSVRASTPGTFNSLDIKPFNGQDAAMYVLGGPSGIRYNTNFNGCIRNFVIDGMKPVEAYLSNDPQYTMYGTTTLGDC
ncbi:mannan-binding lectin serine protease 1-like [Xenia sp. Carnegie-2017]|uniref:mannan-binding lectin serine protease 1-like n=1 Tax=Xenia sp. Carnegie-2017 TaxID=2897299 RepID=UPI001F03D30F|nr:mannan-binding lectin serine protease 1-like [Xenia sp. Carnegie-2017]